MRRFPFENHSSAKRVRDAFEEYLADEDDGRTLTVVLDEDAPDRVRDRIENERFTDRRGDDVRRGEMSELSPGERESLEKGTAFDWNEHGFTAMRAKAALEERGVTEWTDYYEPGGGVDGALRRLRQKKQTAAERGVDRTGIEGDRTDMEDETGGARLRRQAERGMDQNVERAKEAALLEQDESAIEFLEDERELRGDLFDLDVADTNGKELRGSDADLVRRGLADQLAEPNGATETTDPLEAARDPGRFAIPGVGDGWGGPEPGQFGMESGLAPNVSETGQPERPGRGGGHDPPGQQGQLSDTGPSTAPGGWGDLQPSDPAQGYRQANIVRFDTTGRFAAEPPQPAPAANNYRDPHTGQFQGQEVLDPFIDRENSGLFSKPRDGQQTLDQL